MALLVVGHLGGIAVLFPLDISLVIKFIIGAVLVVSLFVAWSKQPGLVGEDGVDTLTWQTDGQWLLETRGGQKMTASLHESTYVNPWMVVLNFRQEGKRSLLSFTLAPDALDPETFRELRVRLKVAGRSEDVD